MPSAPERQQLIASLGRQAAGLAVEFRESFIRMACTNMPDLGPEVLAWVARQGETGLQANASGSHSGSHTIMKHRAPAPRDLVGEQIGRYQVQSRLGSGGMGQVFRAKDLMLGREVALKLLDPRYLDNEVAQRRFMLEAKAAARLDHPNICSVFEIGRDGDHLYIAMQHIDGETLSNRLARRALKLHEALSFAIQLADALGEAHAQGIVHRDLKPQNIMITKRHQAKLLDFGLARFAAIARGESSESLTGQLENLTEAGMVMGTVAYMSPEQAEGAALDHRSDLFSLGIVLYEMVAGVRPFRGGNQTSTMMAILSHRPEPLSAVGNNVPPELDATMARLLGKRPMERHASAGELQRELQGILDGLRGGGAPKAESGPVHARSARPLVDLEPTVVEGPSSSSPSVGSLWPEEKTAIAVLPFLDLSPQKSLDYFCEGMAEELINALSQLEALAVVSRTSAFHFKDRSQDLRAIGEQLKAAMVLEGSVRQAGDRLRITASLVKAADGLQVWTHRYDCVMEDIFEIQDNISAAIVTALKIKLAEGEGVRSTERGTDSLEAYHLYLKGRHLWNKRVAGSVQAAVSYFQESLAADPRYAPAYAGLADAQIVPGYYGLQEPKQAMPKGRALALRALELDPRVPEAHCTLGMVSSTFDFDWERGEQHFRRCIELNPSYATAHMWYALFNLVPTGHLEEARRRALKAQELDPLNAAINTVAGAILYFQRDYDRACLELEGALSLAEDFPIGHYYLGKARALAGNHPGALASFRRTDQLLGGAPVSQGVLAYGLALNGEADEARRLLAPLEAATGYIPTERMAGAHLTLGEPTRALDCLERGLSEQSPLMVWAAVDPLYDPLQQDPRYQAVLRQLNLAG